MNDKERPGPTLERCARVLGAKAEQLRLVGEGANGLIVTDGSGVAYKFPKNRIALQSLSCHTPSRWLCRSIWRRIWSDRWAKPFAAIACCAG